MNREPIGLYIFRFIMGLGLFFFMALLYWSSLLLEQDVKELRREVAAIRGELSALHQKGERLHREILQTLLQHTQERAIGSSSPMDSSPLSLVEKRRPGFSHRDPQRKNLLSDDPFYKEVLPHLLPEGFQPWGVRRAATLGRPDHLHPFSNWASVSSWVRLCTPTVAKNHFGKYETFAPDMAEKVELREEPQSNKKAFWVHLRKGVYWEPLKQEWFPEGVTLSSHFLKRHPVTAHDYKFFWDCVMNPHFQEAGAVSLRNYLGDIEEIEVIDAHTFVVRWKTEVVGEEKRMKYVAQSLTGSLRPLATWVYQYYPDGSKILQDQEEGEALYREDSVFAQTFSQHWARHIIVSCGAWIFDGMSEEKITFRRNPRHYHPLEVLVEEYEIRFKESPEAIWQDFKAGLLDTHSLRPDQLIELQDFMETDAYAEQLAEGMKIQRLDYVGRSYNYVGWNQKTPFFSQTPLRQAMTLAIDRKRIIAQNLNDMGIPITGPFYRYSPSYNEELDPWPYDPQAARQILEEQGWYDRSGTGVREKLVDGEEVPFRFKLTYFVKNPTAKANADYICTALKDVGVECDLHGVDTADLSAVFDDKSFDALYLGWALGTPPEEPRQLWHSSGAHEPGSSNAVGFVSGEADQIIEKLQFEDQLEKRLGLYHRFHALIHEEQPYTFLFTGKNVFLYRDYVQNVFLPVNRQDLIPGANVAEPSSSIFWFKKKS